MVARLLNTKAEINVFRFFLFTAQAPSEPLHLQKKILRKVDFSLWGLPKLHFFGIFSHCGVLFGTYTSEEIGGEESTETEVVPDRNIDRRHIFAHTRRLLPSELPFVLSRFLTWNRGSYLDYPKKILHP